jgi:hypothetical protein
VYKVRRKPWGLSGSPAIVIDPSAWCGVARALCAGEVTKGSWQVPKWLAFVASQVVLLGETWLPGSNTLV